MKVVSKAGPIDLIPNRIDKRGKEIVDSQDVFCKEAEAESVRDDENEGLQKQRVFEPLTAEDAQD